MVAQLHGPSCAIVDLSYSVSSCLHESAPQLLIVSVLLAVAVLAVAAVAVATTEVASTGMYSLAA